MYIKTKNTKNKKNIINMYARLVITIQYTLVIYKKKKNKMKKNKMKKKKKK